jgi:hypothetical protein
MNCCLSKPFFFSKEINPRPNECYVMHGEREISCVWFVFRILEYIVNYGDFICVTCILYVGLVENFKLAVKI